MSLKLSQRVNKQSVKPIYWQVKEMLRASIKRGELKSGDVLPGRLELCRLLGTNRPAVDRAIAELVREGFLVSIKGKGTFVADISSRERTGVLTFAVVWFEPVAPQDRDRVRLDSSLYDNIYWGPLLRGISYAAADLEVQLVFRHCPPDKIAEFRQASKVDGIIALAPYVKDEEILNFMRQQHIPFVATSCSFPDESLPCVDTDNFEGVRQALQHLWDLGHRQIGVVDLALNSCDSLRRWEAFRQFMGEKIDRDRDFFDPRWAILLPTYPCGSPETVIQWMVSLLKQMPLPTAILAVTYEMTLVTLKSLQQCGVSVPQQVSLVGFDDPTSAAFLEPPLTTVRQPLEALGRRAVQKLYEALKEGVMPEGTELLKPELVVRQSTAPPRAN
ncbi:MAG: GntR family transcriptional regulator [Armatimonadetes bacterium]|nr:GntR family transcriptional regulator [Armatimonadota bacterium]MDW8028740.1 GntR family transcriptional regulator [Armatimonadota bacterium]